MGDLTYNRDKNPATNATPITISGEARELPNALVAIAAGTTGAFEVAITGDADPSGGAALVQLWRVALTPTLQSADPGTQGLTLTATPVLGDGSDGTPVVFQSVHPQTMDAWQTAAGFAPVA